MSNAMKVALLFVFYAFRGNAACEPQDTIIIDGKTVVVERRTVEPGIRPADQDPTTGKERVWLLGTSLHWLGTLSSMSATQEGWSTVDQFTGHKSSFDFGFGISAEFGYIVNERWRLLTGLSFSRERVRNHWFDPLALQPDSLRLRFQSLADNQLDEIALYFIDPGFETDTFSVAIHSSHFALNQWSLPLRLEYKLTDNRKGGNWYTGAGLALGIVHQSWDGNILTVTTDGQYHVYSKESLKFRKRTISAQIYAGRLWKVGTRMSAGFRVGINYTPGQVVENTDIRWNTLNGFVSGSLHFFLPGPGNRQ